MGLSRAEVIQSLAFQIQTMEAGGRPRDQPPLSLGIAGLDRLFPEGGLPAGSLVELFSEEAGSGAYTLALLMARQATAESKRALVVVDGPRTFYPPAAARLGVDLGRTLILRPKERQLLSVTNQALRCPAVGAVLARCPVLPPRAFRQFQLAAEAGGGVGLLLRPDTELRSPSFARLRLRISPMASAWHGLAAAGAENNGTEASIPLAPAGAAASSPRRKPWGDGRNQRRSPVGAKETDAVGMDGNAAVLSPLRGFGDHPGRCPTARAVGYYLSPLPGLRLIPTPSDSARQIQLEVIRCRGGKAGQRWLLEIDDETASVHVLPEVAVATPSAGSARTSG